MEPLVARQTWRTLEPLHGMIYFVPEADEQYAKAGLAGGDRAGYFASRSAALGEVPVEAVIAMFFNFNPSLVRDAMRGVWLTVTPEEMLDARLQAADRALRRALGDDEVRSDAMAEAARLARRAAEAACAQLGGRPLFAAHAALDWPVEPHLVLWHAQTLLREYRGDGHIVSLVAAGLDGVEALVTHAASGDVPAGVLQRTRAWSDAEWNAAVARLRERGVIEEGGAQFTDTGREFRRQVEYHTDLLAMPAYEPLGDEGCERLRALARPWSKAVVAAGLLSRGT